MSFAEGIVWPQASQTCCDRNRALWLYCYCFPWENFGVFFWFLDVPSKIEIDYSGPIIFLKVGTKPRHPWKGLWNAPVSEKFNQCISLQISRNFSSLFELDCADFSQREQFHPAKGTSSSRKIVCYGKLYFDKLCCEKVWKGNGFTKHEKETWHLVRVRDFGRTLKT